MMKPGPLPRLDSTNQFFWEAGAAGVLRFLRCQTCGLYQHPPRPRCPNCRGEELEPESVSGRATVLTFSVNYQAWRPDMDVPFVVAIVGIEEQEGLRLTTNIIGCAIEEVQIGMPVQVVFEKHEDVWIPYFAPRP